MSIKDDVNYVKRELSGDEKVLESAFKLESLYKKYKFQLWGVIVVVILFFGGRSVMSVLHEAKLEKANEAFLTLQRNRDDTDALKVLQENNPALLELYHYAQAVKKEDVKTLESLSSSTNSVVADASAYTAGVLNKKPVDSKLYKEMSLFEEAYLAILAGDAKTAQNKLELIDDRSSLSVIKEFLKHSTIKAN
ncbi:hypothetical protein [Sulfurovum sp. TSL1]|uniref:hypothetical protein n=1 Tax=Sulfurovum sp. TSL1 TaxID=2826994 RepID=UPI001CC4DE83|nr:hypothetical protein [Sulfurovum sp. TSL1]GIT99061.1 hypothetical protein TSL1_18820 [Sulfurovum sp. TSL1]